jgi:benzodiazapine receptor
MPRRRLLLLFFLLTVVGVSGLLGYATAPGDWYAELEKPPFNPPDWLFGPVWLALYICIAVAGWRTSMREPHGNSMLLWYSQMLLNWLWLPVFFSFHLLWPAVAVILALLAAILGFIVARWHGDRLAAALFVPYAAWVAFAALLNISIAMLN